MAEKDQEKIFIEAVERKSYGHLYFMVVLIGLIMTLWAFWDEVITRRPWKKYQKEFNRLELARAEAELKQAQAKLNTPEYKELEKKLAEAEKDFNSHKGSYQEAVKRLKEAKIKLFEVTQEQQFLKSEADEAFYWYSKALHENDKDVLIRKHELDKLEAKVKEMQPEIDKWQAEVAAIEKEIEGIKGNLENLQAEKRKYTADIEQIQRKIEGIKARPIEIKQIIVEKSFITNFGNHISRAERCMTCHVAIDRAGFEDASIPQPFRTHPKRQEIFGKHPIDKFGCTLCHAGQGAALTVEQAHNGEQQVKAIHDQDKPIKINHNTEFWARPLFLGENVQIGCRKCHEVDRGLEEAPRLTQGRRNFEELGCHGCHLVRGYENYPKVGPDLTRVGDKVTAAWMFQWIKNPRTFRVETRMPNFLLSDEETEAIVAYLMNVTKGKFLARAPGKKTKNEGTEGSGDGNSSPSSASYFAIPVAFSENYQPSPERGKELVRSVGCLGCHVIGEGTEIRNEQGNPIKIVPQVDENGVIRVPVPRKSGRKFGPDLSGIGSKTNFQWLVRWLKDPKSYDPKTPMPNFRLTDEQAQDIAAYLMTLKWEGESKILGLEEKIKDPALIEKGTKLIRNYGCFGCHTIPGMEREQRIGAELTTFGNKWIAQMSFGNATHIPETWWDWTENKLRNPRIYATEREILRMPNFGLLDEDIKAIAMFLKSLTGEEREIPDYIYKPDPAKMALIQGRELVRQYNCIGCHVIENKGGVIRAFYKPEELNMAPPLLEAGELHEGEKVRHDWLSNFLKNPVPIRPWLKVRMPTFGFSDEEVATLVSYFSVLAKKRFPYELPQEHPLLPDMVQAGARLASPDYLNCFNCHQQGDKKPEGPPEGWAPDLALATSRLNPDWIVKWIKDPQKIQPGTKMPMFFPDENSGPEDILEGKEEQQILALRDYILSLGSIPTGKIPMEPVKPPPEEK
jgi:mono/diheme cytochrome c family protein